MQIEFGNFVQKSLNKEWNDFISMWLFYGMFEKWEWERERTNIKILNHA